MYKITNTTKRAAAYAALSLEDRVFKQRTNIYIIRVSPQRIRERR
ncbi:MAG: hypothetical protein ACI4JR_00610 [Acutalibacteraceae bacterium]